MNKIPCATCDSPCENTIRLYHFALVLKEKPESVTIKKIGLHCQKTGETFELEVK